MYVKFDKGQKFTRKAKVNQEISDSLEDFDDAGYILHDNEVVVDIDNLSKEQIVGLIDEFNLVTKTVWTKRGVHLYFKKPRGFRWAKGMTIFGFPVEYKHTNNTYAITVKQNGVARETQYPNVLKDLPNFLMPARKQTELLGYDEGDGRNDALYQTKRMAVNMGNTQKILRYINSFIFAKPLPESEFDVVSREEVMQAEKDNESAMADLIMRENRMIKHQGSLFFYYNDEFTNDEDDLTKLVYEYCPGMKTRYVDEVIKQMKYRAEKTQDQEFKIKLKNGFLYQGKFYETEYNGFTPYCIDINYYPDAPPVDKVDDYLDNLSNHDPNYKNFILEIIANSLITDNEFKRHLAKFFIFVGDGGNGKGTLLQIITKILGEKNVAANSISELADEKYAYALVGKLANLGDDIQDEPINRKEMKILKNLSTGDRIQIRRLYENSTTARLYPTLIFTSNHVLKSFDKDYSYKRRVVWCPMYYKPERAVSNFISQLTTPESLEYWLRLIVEAYQRLYENQEYTQSKIVDKFNDEYHRENDTTIEFVENLTDEQIEWYKPLEIYNNYKTWCEGNGDTPLAKKHLKAKIMERGYIVKNSWKNGVQKKCYRKKEENS